MDNVVQNISIDDIIPSNFQPSKEEKRKIEELSTLIKQFGLIDPILVRQKDGKYEIVLGMETYQAALLANQTMVPAIIKEVDDETFSKYRDVDYKQDVSLNSLPTENFSKKEEDSDIVNLSELSKIKLEYERDDVKMNNGQINNDMVNNNLGQQNMSVPSQEPTFGGRFFPSLEDEPTNMNMMGGLNNNPTAPVAPSINNNELNNSNLIDLTDLSTDKEPIPNVMPTPGIAPQTINVPTPEPIANPNMNQPPQNNFELPNLGPVQSPTNDNIINLESLQNNNPAVQPISEPVSMEILNADFGAPQQPPVNQFDMGMNNVVNPAPQPEINSIPNMPQPDLGLNQPTMIQPETPSMNTNIQPDPNYNINPQQPIQQNFEPVAPVSTPEINASPAKDVTPVTNTIKNLVASLEAFGYKINLTEEDLTNISKITIEVEK